jgi:sulfide dehydrogenase cytochrome subunit
VIVILAAVAALTAPPPGATACLGCHGAPGSALPSLRGKTEGDILAAMTAFRTGARPATLMDRIAKGFSEDETKAISAWIGSRK